MSETIKNKAKEQKGWCLGMLLGILAAALLQSALASKPKIPGWGVKELFEPVKVRIFLAVSSFNNF